MSQGQLSSPTTGTVSGLALTENYNAALAALASANSGASAPANADGGPPEGQLWLDQSSSPPVVRMYDGANWLALGRLDDSNHIWKPPVGGGAASLASASTVDLGSVPDSSISITGTTAITSFGSSMIAGTIKVLTFSAALVLTNGSNLILPGGANIATAAGDTAVVEHAGGGVHRVIAYQRASGKALVVDTQTPTGIVADFFGAAAPSGWVAMDGGTIGDASSGAGRANADTQALFTLAWSLDPSVSPILTSGGATSSRGASAAADWAAHRRLTIPDQRGVFRRGYNGSGSGTDSGRTLGDLQQDDFESHTHTANVTDPGHTHTYTKPNGSANTVIGANQSFLNGTQNTSTGSSPTGIGVTNDNTGGTETRPLNRAWLTCVKL